MKSRWISIPIIISAMVILLSSCKQKSVEYLYIDKANVIHSKADCKNVEGHPLIEVGLTDIEEELSDDIDVSLCSKCLTQKQERMLSIKISSIRRLKFVYNGLSSIGEDVWGSEASFMDFISFGDSIFKLNKYLKEKGYNSRDIENFANGITTHKFTHSIEWQAEFAAKYNMSIVEWNDEYCKWIYFSLMKNGCNLGTYKEFMRYLNNEDDFIWCYHKCKEYGLTNGWDCFLNNIIDTDCDD